MGKSFAIFPSMISAPILDLPDLWHCHYSMPSQGATLFHTSLDVARRRLGHIGQLHQDSLKHCTGTDQFTVIQRERCFRPVFTGIEQPLFTKKSRISANGGGKGNTMVFGCLFGNHTKMPVKLAPSSHCNCERSCTLNCKCS